MTCSVKGCQSPVKGRGWCNLHYHRWRAYGDPEALRLGPYEPRGDACKVDGCLRPVKAKGLCTGHYMRMKTHGVPGGLLVERVPSYGSVHNRLAARRGPASEYDCAICHVAPAVNWAYDHTDSNEQQSKRGPYSTDLSRYLAACLSCHHRLDNRRLHLLIGAI